MRDIFYEHFSQKGKHFRIKMKFLNVSLKKQFSSQPILHDKLFDFFKIQISFVLNNALYATLDVLFIWDC